MTRRRHRAAIGVTAALALLLACTVTASASLPGTIVLTSSTSASALSTVIAGDSSYGIVYRTAATSTIPGDLDVAQAGSPPVVITTALDPCAAVSVNGPMVVAFGSCTGSRTLSWWDLAGGSGSQALPSSADFLGASPTGWFETLYDSTNSQFEVYDVPAIDPMTPVSLGAPNSTMGEFPFFADNSTGIVIGEDEDSAIVPYYETIADAPDWVALDDTTTITAIFFASSSDVLMEGKTGDVYELVDAPESGAAATQLAVTAPNGIEDAAQSATAIAWTDYDSTDLETMPAGGGATSTMSGLTAPEITSDGTAIYLSRGTTATSGGIYTVTSASSSPSLVVRAGAAPEVADAVAESVGRVSWASTQSTSVWSRAVTAAASRITAKQRVVAAGLVAAMGDSIVTSGIRTVAVTPTDTVVASTSGVLSTIAHLSALDRCRTSTCGHVVLSGTLAVLADRTTSPSVYSFATRTLTKLKGVTFEFPLIDPGTDANDDEAALFGDDLVYLAPGGAIMQKVIGTTAAPVTLQRELGAPSKVACYGSAVVTWGSWAAWENVCYRTSNFSELPVHTYLKHLDSKAAPVELATTGYPLSISNDWLLMQRDDSIVAMDIATKATRVVNATDTAAAVDGAIVTWINANGSVSAGVLGSVTDAPRYLDDPIAPATIPLAAAHPAWTAEFDASAPLTTCHVEILLRGAVVTTLACTAADMAYGVAKVTWTAKPSARFAAPGTYVFTYRLIAANKYGALTSTLGTAISVTGTFKGIRP